DMGTPFTAELAAILQGIDSWNWGPVAESLSRLGVASPGHAATLAANLNHSSRTVRWSAAHALGKLGDAAEEQTEALVKLLSAE
ncbi:unnamed protein product, partial [Effrenium voratum]